MKPAIFPFLGCALPLLMISLSRAEDWPQAQGINRDNRSAEIGLLDQWPEQGPELAWTFQDAGVGGSSVRKEVIGICLRFSPKNINFRA